MLAVHVAEEVGDGDRGLLGTQFDDDAAQVGLKADFLGDGLLCFAESENGKQKKGNQSEAAFHTVAT